MPRKTISAFVIFAFLTTAVPVPSRAGEVFLPAPGARMAVSPAFMPPMILGITVDPVDPLKFNFLIDQGDQKVPAQDQEEEFKQLIKYFLASLTIPEKDLWVNLSPYEGQRIIPPAFGQTEMGRDLLGQDYVLKQITASLIYPESELGKKFWADVYKKAHEQYGTTNIPVNTFNKVWIVPDEAMVYEHDGTAFVVKSHLKVMLEEDYLALEKGLSPPNVSVGGPGHDDPSSGFPTKAFGNDKGLNTLGSQVVREIILPVLEKEVNEGKNFALLRQINNALVLATWYKRALKESLLGKFYVDKAKVKGVDHADQQANEKIYQHYLEAFKKGVYNFIKEDRDPYTRQTIPRKYFSGGFEGRYAQVVQVTRDQSQVSEGFIHRIKEGMDGRIVDVAMRAEDEAMISKPYDFIVQGEPREVPNTPELKKFAEGIESRIRIIIKNIQEIKDQNSDEVWKKNIDGVSKQLRELMAYVRVRHEDATVKALQNTITAGFYQKNRSLVTVWDLPNMIVSAVGWAQSFSSNPLPKYLNEVKKAMVKFQEEIRWILSLVSGIRNSKNVEIIGQARDPEGTRSVEAVDPRPYISFGTAVAVNEPAPPVDAAMNAAVKAPGGIDLNPANLNLRIKRDGKGVPLPIGRQDMGDLGRIEGLVPVIIKIVPATYIPALSDVLAAVD